MASRITKGIRSGVVRTATGWRRLDSRRQARRQDKNSPQAIAQRLGHHVPFRLRPHHARPVRKRHLFGLSVSALLLILAGLMATRYMYDQMARQLGASISVYEQTGASAAGGATGLIWSSRGYGVRLQTSSVVVSGVEQAGLGAAHYYYGADVTTRRAYDSLNFLPASSYGASLTVTAAIDRKTTSSSAQAVVSQDLFTNLNKPRLKNQQIKQLSEATETIGGVLFVHREYSYDVPATAKDSLELGKQHIDQYVGFLADGTPIIMRIAVDSQDSAWHKTFVQIVHSFVSEKPRVSSSTDSKTVGDRSGALSMLTHEPGLLSIAGKLGLGLSTAAAAPKAWDQARIVATNSPAVVKVYHVVCGQITYKGQQLTVRGCSGSTGSGFFVSGDGYVATNGHVVTSSVKDMVIQNMSVDLLTKMLQIDGRSDDEIAAMLQSVADATDGQGTVAQAVNKLSDSALQFAEQKDIYIVALAGDAPDTDQIVKDQSFVETPTIRAATLTAMNYDPSDLYNPDGFTHSDVALLKISGTNYPVTHIGSLDTVAQGDALTVIGFPGEAEQNSLTRSTSLQSTATKGIVSAIRTVNGSTSNRVVQSDVMIGHGNSGGPAFDSYGRVFGIATYLLGGSTNGDAAITYLRDVRDLTTLAAAHQVKLSDSSRTQQLWEQGLQAFYAAHYKQAVRLFEDVKRQYPEHTAASTYIALAQAKIAAGEEAGNRWEPIAIIALLLASITGVLVFVVMIIRHRAHHHLYKAIQLGYVRGAFASMQPVKHHAHQASHS